MARIRLLNTGPVHALYVHIWFRFRASSQILDRCVQFSDDFMVQLKCDHSYIVGSRGASQLGGIF